MKEYIDKAALSETMPHLPGFSMERVKYWIADIPPAEVRENVRGRWEKQHRHPNSYKRVTGIDDMGIEHTITIHEEAEYDWFRCPFCHASAADNFQNFCPNCGADMREAPNETDPV